MLSKCLPVPAPVVWKSFNLGSRQVHALDVLEPVDVGLLEELEEPGLPVCGKIIPVGVMLFSVAYVMYVCVII